MLRCGLCLDAFSTIKPCHYFLHLWGTLCTHTCHIFLYFAGMLCCSEDEEFFAKDFF
jgi:hypothetical protein